MKTFIEKVKVLKIRRKTVVIFQLILMIVMLSIYLNGIVKPSTFSFLGLFALLFPVLLIVHILLSICWIFKNYKLAILFFVSIVFYYPIIRTYFQAKNEIQPFKNGFKVLTLNTRYAYDTNIKNLEKYLKSSQADVIFLQEIYTRQWKDENTFLTDRNNAFYPYVGISTTYPIVRSSMIKLPNNGHSCMADILIKEDTIRCINIYLEPMYITKKIFEINGTDELTKNSLLLKNKLTMGFQIHEIQLKIIKELIRSSPYPIVLAGDFNSVPFSYEYSTINSLLNDGFTTSGKGFGTTFHGYFYPLRLDYIWHSTDFSTENYLIDISKKLSDHNPVSLELKLNPNK